MRTDTPAIRLQALAPAADPRLVAAIQTAHNAIGRDNIHGDDWREGYVRSAAFVEMFDDDLAVFVYCFTEESERMYQTGIAYVRLVGDVVMVDDAGIA